MRKQHEFSNRDVIADEKSSKNCFLRGDQN